MRPMCSNIPEGKGTKAAAMEDQVPEQVKAERSSGASGTETRHKQEAYESRLLGTTQEVLVEEEVERNGERLSGWTYQRICESAV